MDNSETDFCKKSLMKSDHFWLVHLCSIGIFSRKIVRIYLISAILSQFIMYAFEICMFIIEPSYIVKYAPFLLTRTYGVAAALAILWKRSYTENLWQDTELWSVDSAGKQISSKAEAYLKNANIVVSLTLLMGFLCCVLIVSMPNDVAAEFSLDVFLLQKWYPKTCDVPIVFLKFIVIPILYAMIVHPLLVLYGSQHIRLQLLMLIERIKNMTVDFEMGAERLEDLNGKQLFQCEVNKRLLFSIVKHTELIRFANRATNEMIKPLFVVFGVFGFMLGLSLVVIVYEAQLYAYNNSQITILFIVGGILAVFCFCYLIHGGQAATSLTEEAYWEICNLKWYTFNKANRNTMMLMLANTLKPMSLRFTTNLAVDYGVGIRMVKAFYSVISLMITLHLKHKI